METTTKSPEETKALGGKIAADLAISHQPLVIALTGDLGSGKTTFVKGFAKGLGVKQRILSPTFILMRKYDVPISHQTSTISHFFHIDLYRFEDNVESEVRNLGIEEIWSDPQNIVAIEWAEKIKSVVPKNAIWIRFENLGEEKRRISLDH